MKIFHHFIIIIYTLCNVLRACIYIICDGAATCTITSCNVLRVLNPSLLEFNSKRRGCKNFVFQVAQSTKREDHKAI